MKFVTLTSVQNSYQAYFVREELAREGIESMAVNENLANLYAGGFVIECIIRVMDTDLDKAKQVLEKMKAETVVTCPNCGSKKVEYGAGTKNAIKRALKILIAFTMGIVSTEFAYHCYDCDSDFRKDPL